MHCTTADITSNEMGEATDISGDDILEIRDRSKELDRSKESINPDQIRSHLKRLEIELSSVFRSLRSDPDNVSLQEVGN